MYVSNTAVALTITKKEAPFTDKASMLRWVAICAINGAVLKSADFSVPL